MWPLRPVSSGRASLCTSFRSASSAVPSRGRHDRFALFLILRPSDGVRRAAKHVSRSEGQEQAKGNQRRQWLSRRKGPQCPEKPCLQGNLTLNAIPSRARRDPERSDLTGDYTRLAVANSARGIAAVKAFQSAARQGTGGSISRCARRSPPAAKPKQDRTVAGASW